MGGLDSNLKLEADNPTVEAPCTSVMIAADGKEFGKKLANGFLGWHYSSTNALGRTTHAIVSFCMNQQQPSKYIQVHEYLKGFFTRDQADEYDFFKDLQILIKQFNRSQPNLVENAHVVVKGPGPGAIATLCIVNDYIRPTPTFFIIVREICNHLDDIIASANNGNDWNHLKRPGNKYFWETGIDWRTSSGNPISSMDHDTV